MVSAAVLAAAALAETAVAPAKREPFRIVNEASFTASCSLMVLEHGFQPFEIDPGETWSSRLPEKRGLRLICLKGKTRDTPLRPGRTYRLIEVDGHLEIAPDAAAPPAP